MADENKKKEEQELEVPAADNKEQETPAAPATVNTEEQPAPSDEVRRTPSGPDAATRARLDLAEEQLQERIDTEKAYNTQIGNVNDFISQVNAKKQELSAQDQQYQKRENAYRYIAGIGDAISGIANLVGVAEGNAANQKQTYNAPAVIQKAEQSRKKRKLEMDKLNERLDEMKARGKDLRAAKDLKTAELNAQQAKERRALETQQTATERENYWKQKRLEMDAAKSVASIAENEAERKWKSEQNAADRASREAINAADNASREAIERQRAEVKDAQDKEKLARDPEYKASVLRQNVTGIRDELARKMGYQDYNEYLKGKNWKKNTLKKNQPNDIYEQRVKEFPEIEELLNGLANPEMLSEESIDMYIGASDVFADAVNAKSAPVQVDESGREIVEY